MSFYNMMSDPAFGQFIGYMYVWAILMVGFCLPLITWKLFEIAADTKFARSSNAQELFRIRDELEMFRSESKNRHEREKAP